MSTSNHHFLAILPLFAILSISPMQLDKQSSQSRSVASEVISAHPKYEARAGKIDRTKIEIDKDLDLGCFSDRAQALRNRILELRKDYKVGVIEKDAVSLQKTKLQSVVSSMVDLEEDMKILKEKKAWDGGNDVTIADTTMAELKTTIESLLLDEVENDLAVLKDTVSKEQAAQVAIIKPELPAKDDAKKDPILCELEDQNKVLTKQVAELIEQQKQIMQTMLGLTNMMVQMNQQSQMLPSWMTSGSMMNPQQLYPTMPQGQWVYYSQGAPQPIMPAQWEPNVQTQTPQSQQRPQMGQQQYLQYGQGEFNYMPQQQSYMAPSMNMSPGTFGSNPGMFNFAQNGSSMNAAFGV